MGPGTGRGLGPCGAGRGFGRLLGCPLMGRISQADEKACLEEDVQDLKAELLEAQKRLGELGKGSKK